MTTDELKQLKEQTQDYFVRQYMDLDNGKNLDKKERVLTALAQGRKPPEIPEYDDVLDLWEETEPDLADIKLDF